MIPIPWSNLPYLNQVDVMDKRDRVSMGASMGAKYGDDGHKRQEAYGWEISTSKRKEL